MTEFWQLPKWMRNGQRPQIRGIKARLNALYAERKQLSDRLHQVNHTIKLREAELKHWENL